MLTRVVVRRVPPVKPAGEAAGELRLVADPQYRRLHATVDMDLALQLYNVYRYHTIRPLYIIHHNRPSHKNIESSV